MKTYLSRAQTKAMSAWEPIGDPTGGAAYGEYNDPVTAMAGATVVSGLMGANASRSAASQQADAATAAAQSQLAATRETNAQQQAQYQQNVERMAPYTGAGVGALNQLTTGLAPGGQFTQNFRPSDLTTDPSYAWRMQQGTQNLNASAAARGLLGSGQNLKDITDYGQNAASQEYQNAFNRYQTQQSNLYNRISGLASLGENAAAGVGNQGIQVAQNIGQNTMTGMSNANNYMTSGATAGSAGTVGSANAISNALSGGIGQWQTMQYLNKFSPTAQTSASGFGMDAPAPVNPNYGLGGNLPTIQG